MRLIDADALKDWSEIVPLTCDGGIDINDFEEKLKSMPTVDAEPVEHGHWMEFAHWDKTVHCNYVHIMCSKCTKYVANGWEHNYLVETVSTHYKYCPYCGAKMDADRKEECMG